MVLTLLFVGGISWRALAEDKDKPKRADIRGTISSLTSANEDAKKKGILGSILVEGVKEATTTYDKASIKVTTKTSISRKTQKGEKPYRFDDLKKGAKVQVDFIGPVAESYPVQATAKSIVVLEVPKEKQ